MSVWVRVLDVAAPTDMQKVGVTQEIPYRSLFFSSEVFSLGWMTQFVPFHSSSSVWSTFPAFV